MASATELFNIGSSVDPYGKFREAQLAPMQYDIKQANLEEQLKEIRQDQEAQKQQQPGLGTMGGGVTMPSGGLSGMAKTINPNWKLVDDNGLPTTAGQINDFTLQSMEEGKAGAKLMKQAKFMEPGSKDQINTISEGRRLLNNSMMYRNKATELAKNTQNDAIYAAATAKDQTQWDNAIKSYQESGLPIPQGIPTEYTPDNVKKIAQLAPAQLQSKINNDLIKRQQEERLVKSAELRDQKLAASMRDGTAGKGGGMRSAIIEQRQDTLAVNATEFVRTLQNITDLPAESTSGIFGGKTAGSLFTAPLEAAANTLTSDSVQRYNSEMGGLGNHLAWMVSGGLSPSVAVQEKFDSILKIKEGDSQAAVLTKLARARQEAENVLAVKMKSRLMSDEMKDMLRGLDDDLKKTIPFTVKEVNQWKNDKDKKETFNQFMGRTIGGGESKGSKPQGAGTKEDPIKL